MLAAAGINVPRSPTRAPVATPSPTAAITTGYAVFYSGSPATDTTCANPTFVRAFPMGVCLPFGSNYIMYYGDINFNVHQTIYTSSTCDASSQQGSTGVAQPTTCSCSTTTNSCYFTPAYFTNTLQLLPGVNTVLANYPKGSNCNGSPEYYSISNSGSTCTPRACSSGTYYDSQVTAAPVPFSST